MMKRIFSLFGCGALICAAANLSTQSVNAADAAKESDELNYRPFTLGVEASSTGLGGSANWRFTDHLGARVGFNYFEYSDSGNEFMGAQINIVDTAPVPNVIGQATINKTYRLMSEPLGLDYYPWKKSSFRITVGIMVNQNEATGVVSANPIFGGTSYWIGNAPYDSASIGDLTMKVEQQPVSPYISIGASYYLDKAKHWSLSGELGVAYTGSADVTVTTGIPNSVNPADLNALGQQIEDGTWQFYPILRIGVNYSF